MEEEKYIDKLKEAQSILSDMQSFDKERARQSVYDRTINAKKQFSLKKIWHVAALFILPLVCSFFTYIYMENRNASDFEAYVTVTAPQSGVMEYLLPDSSIVWLSNGSSLKYQVGLAHLKTRSVAMTGEGYFDVKHNAVHPFIVSVGGLDVEVKGTEFNCFEKPESVEITLVNGVIEVQQSDGKVLELLTENQQLIFDRKSGTYELEKGLDCRPYTAWRNNELYFSDSDFNLVVERISRFFHVSVNVENLKLYDKKLTANFKNESVDDVVFILSAITGAKYNIELKNNIKTITFK